MKKLAKTLLTVACYILIVSQSAFAQDGNDIVTKMHQRYAGKWYKTFTFVQTTEFYRNDSLKGKSTWYEAALFPYDFRIDTGDPKDGNGVIYSEDSSYYFSKGKLARVEAGTNPFTFLLGGIYAVPLETVFPKLKSRGYDLSKTHDVTWNGRKVHVIGASAGDTLSNQFWVDSENLYLVRTIQTEIDTRIDARMSDHIKVGNGWSETKVVLYLNGKLRQIEYYRDIKGDQPIDKRIYDPRSFGKFHWMK